MKGSMFIKCWAVVDSCRTDDQLSLAYSYLIMAYNQRLLSWPAAMDVYHLFLSKRSEVCDEPSPLPPFNPDDLSRLAHTKCP